MIIYIQYRKCSDCKNLYAEVESCARAFRIGIPAFRIVTMGRSQSCAW